MVELTAEQFKMAEIRGRARLEGPRAESAYHDADRDRIIVRLTTGIELGFTPAAVEGLQNASTEDLKEIEIESFGLGIHFPRVDADLYVPALLEGVLGSKRWMPAQLNVAGGRVQAGGRTAASDQNGELDDQSYETPQLIPTIQRPSSMTLSETTVAVFDTATHAEAAIADLVAQGIPASSIEHYAQSGGTAAPAATSSGTTSHGGLWASLTGEQETSTQHNALYDKSIESGGIVVTVISDTNQVERVHTILGSHDPIDLDERHLQYSASGAYGMSTGAADMAMPVQTTAQPVTTGTAQVLTLSEEALQVGKRAVDRGTTRVRRYVVERPVEEQIRLRDETVTVYRRPIAAGTTIGTDAFTDRVITMTETDEEAVVAKTARVVEEVVLQKDVVERVETVRDTVRHEEVEIAAPTVRTTDATPTDRSSLVQEHRPGLERE